MAIEVRGICPLLQVFDMAASLAFYREVLAFEVVQTPRRRATPSGTTLAGRGSGATARS